MEDELAKKLLEKLDRLEEILLMQVVLLIENNGLNKKLNYISGTTKDFTIQEFKEEMDYLVQLTKCLTQKGALCPIRGLTRKVGKGLKEEDVSG